MTILEFVTVVSGGASIASAVDVIRKHFTNTNSTPEELFKKSFVAALKQIAPSLDDVADPKAIEVDHNALNKVIASLKDIDINKFATQEADEKLAEATILFRDCINLPGCRLRNKDLLQRLQSVLERTFTNFYDRLPHNEQASNQMLLKFDRMQLEGQKHLSEQSRAIQDAVQGLDAKVTDISNRHPNINISDAVETAIAKEYQSEIDDTRVLLETCRPKSALDQFEKLKERIWTEAPPIVKFRLLTNMAAAHFELNNEQNAGELLREAFQYNSEDEKAFSNRALAHYLFGELENAAEYAKQTLEKNPANINARVVLIHVFSKKEPLERVITQVPDYLQEKPQIAHAFSDIAKEQGDLKVARKWREIMVEQDGKPGFKASLATILIEQVLDAPFNMYIKQLEDSQKEQLSRAVELLTEAWDSVVNTELRAARTDWIINRSTAYRLLGESEAAIKDLDVAIEIEPLDSMLSMLLKNRAILAFEQGDNEGAIEYLERIQSEPEIFEAQIRIASILFGSKRYDEAITKLTDFLKTNPSSELQNEANRWLVRIYIATEHFEEAKRILTTLQESSPTSILNFINAAQVANGTEKHEEAISFLKDAYEIAKNCEASIEITELADELFDHQQFMEAATLYEKLADTRQNSQFTIGLLASYYNAGEIGKALEICKELREKYGPLENISEREVMIYEEIGDMNQAEVVCKAYLNEFPNDIDMQIRLGLVYYRSNKEKKIDHVLGNFSDFKNFSFLENLSLEACVQLASLYQVRSQPEKVLQVMYETRRTHFDNRDAHLQYIRLFYQVDKQIPDLLNLDQVQLDTAVQIDSSNQPVWYIIVDRDDIDVTRSERAINDTFAKRLLGKRVGDEVDLGKTPLGQRVGKITDIKSKYIYACQESFQEFESFFPDDEGLWSVKLDESSGNLTDNASKKTASTNLQPILEFTNKQHEASLEIENVYKKHLPPIGVFMNWTGRSVLDVWNLLINKPDLGIRCCEGSPEEKSLALALLKEPKPKLVVDIISLITLHCLEAADTVVKTFGKLAVAQSTIDALLQMIHEQESMWSQREGMSIEKQGNRYVRHMINPDDVKRSVERLKGLIKWIRENCEVLPCTPALQMNQLRKRKLDEMFHPIFVDTLFIATQPGHLLLSDDERLRFYAKTDFNSDAETNFQIERVWTQIILEHCLNLNVLDKAKYDKMIIQLVCSNYYHTEFDTDVLMEALKQANWNLAEPYNSLVQALGGQKMSPQKALNVAVDFLFKIWEEQIPYNQLKFVTLGLLAGLTSGRNTLKVLDLLEKLIQNKHRLFLPVENRILRQIQEYEQLNPFERNFEFLSDDDIRIKGTRIGIEDVLYESLHLSQTPEEIVQHFHTLTLDLVYATILYYLQNPVEVGNYLTDNLKYSQRFREEYERNPPPGVVRLRQLKAEKQTKPDDSHKNIPKNNSTTSSPPRKEQK